MSMLMQLEWSEKLNEVIHDDDMPSHTIEL